MSEPNLVRKNRKPRLILFIVGWILILLSLVFLDLILSYEAAILYDSTWCLMGNTREYSDRYYMVKDNYNYFETGFVMCSILATITFVVRDIRFPKKYIYNDPRILPERKNRKILLISFGATLIEISILILFFLLLSLNDRVTDEERRMSFILFICSLIIGLALLIAGKLIKLYEKNSADRLDSDQG